MGTVIKKEEYVKKWEILRHVKKKLNISNHYDSISFFLKHL